MSELQADITSLFEETERFLKSQARNEGATNHPLTLRTEYKTNLKLTDSEKNVFEVDESFLSAFRDIYTDKSYKVVRLSNWELEIKFNGKKCNKIDLISESVTFLASKSVKREITACHFKIPIIQSEAELKKLSPEIHGFLNRLGKRNICQQSENIAASPQSLLSFAAVKAVKPQTFNFKPWSKSVQSSIDAKATLTPEGRKVLEKLRAFISRKQIESFLVEQQVSEQANFELRKLLTGAKQ